ncbi:5024_t:CDS:2 [Gigaspora rosea]|nr:5024_t:CDS:2 [Gigaspora rosea]
MNEYVYSQVLEAFCLDVYRSWLNWPKKKILEQEIANMLDAGIIRPSSSSWLSLVVLENQKKKTYFCIDYW